DPSAPRRRRFSPVTERTSWRGSTSRRGWRTWPWISMRRSRCSRGRARPFAAAARGKPPRKSGSPAHSWAPRNIGWSARSRRWRRTAIAITRPGATATGPRLRRPRTRRRATGSISGGESSGEPDRDSGSASRKNAAGDRSRHVADRPRNRGLEIVAAREVGRDRGREAAAAPVRRPRRDAPVLERPERSSVPEEVADAVARRVPSRDQDRACAELADSPRRPADVALRPDTDARKRSCLVPVRRHEIGERKEIPAKSAETGRRKENRSARGDEHRIENDGLSAKTAQAPRHRPDRPGAPQHAASHRGGREVREDRVDLSRDEAGRERFDRKDAVRVLR